MKICDYCDEGYITILVGNKPQVLKCDVCHGKGFVEEEETDCYHCIYFDGGTFGDCPSTDDWTEKCKYFKQRKD